MSVRLRNTISTIAQRGFAFPPADEAKIVRAQQRGVPDRLLDLYQLADGLFVIDGDDFSAPSGRRFRFRVPQLQELQSVAEFGYAFENSPLFSRLRNWWQFFDYGDANWIGMTDAEDGFRIIDLFHETVGQTGSHAVLAETLDNFLGRIMSSNGAFWLRDSFESLDRL